MSIVRQIIFFSRIYNAETIRFFDTPFKYDSQELSPRNKREQFLISQLSWLPFVGQQLATNFPRPRIHRMSGSCATVQVRCFPTKCFPLRFFYSIIRGGGPLNKEKGVLERKGGKSIYIRDNWGNGRGKGRVYAQDNRLSKENWRISIAIDPFISMDDEFSFVYFLSNWISPVIFRIL